MRAPGRGLSPGLVCRSGCAAPAGWALRLAAEQGRTSYLGADAVVAWVYRVQWAPG